MTQVNSPTVALAAQLIRQQSVTPDDAGCQAILAERLRAIGFEIDTINCGQVSNIWARRGEHSPLLAFVGHTDVVPTGEASNWDYPPFSAHLANGMLHGRGAADMKGSIAAMVCACERFFARHTSIPGSIAFLITSDEEGEAVDGTRYVMEKLAERDEKIDCCLVGEPTSQHRLGDMIKIGRRGSLCGSLTVHGKQGHVAYPHLADNPIHRSGALIDEISKMIWNDGDEQFPDTTLQISNVHAGVGVGNVIPGTLQMEMNFRHSPASDPQDLIDAVETVCKTLNLDYRASWSVTAEPYRTERREFADTVAHAVEDVLDNKPERSTTGGTSDGRFVSKYGAEVVEFGPLNATIHKINECVGVEDLNKLSEIYEVIIERMFATDLGEIST